MNIIIKELKVILFQSVIILCIIKAYQIFMGLPTPALFQLIYFVLGLNLINYCIFGFIVFPMVLMILNIIKPEESETVIVYNNLTQKFMLAFNFLWQISNTTILICTIFSRKFDYVTQFLIIFIIYAQLLIYSVGLMSTTFPNVFMSTYALHAFLNIYVFGLCYKKYSISVTPSFELLSLIFLGIIILGDIFFIINSQNSRKPKSH